jgi:prolyl oligopeptidase
LVAGRPAWRKVCDFDDLVTNAALVGDRLYLLSNRDRPRGRVLETSAIAPDLAGAREVVPQGEAVIEGLAGAPDGVIVTLMDGGVQRLGRIAPGGRGMTMVTMPFDGAVGGVFTSPDHDGAHVMLSSWLQPITIYRLGRDGSLTDARLNPPPAIDVSPYDTRRAFAVARDGTRIPYTILFRRGMAADGTNPTLITAYGAYQSSSLPIFSPRLFAFLDAGGVYGVANVRGGGEYGRAWHLGGFKASKPNTWRDLIAVCEQLIHDRVTTPAHLAILGGSAGGITVGRAMTERPDLFAAVVNMVGWVNPLRYTAEQNVADIDEWGPIVDAESFRIMLAMDAYQSVIDGTRYPAVLCTTGVTDPRVAPWHMAKFAARLQAATASARPVLLRVDFDAGHGIGSTRTQADALYADAYSFVLWQTGARGFQPG